MGGHAHDLHFFLPPGLPARRDAGRRGIGTLRALCKRDQVGHALPPRKLLTPTVALVAMLANHAADAGYIVVIPLAAIVFANRWQKDFGIGSLTTMMIPYFIWMLISGVLLMILWMVLGMNPGPGAPMGIDLQSMKP